MTHPPAVQIERVSKHYAQGRAAVPAVRDLTLAVGRGEFLSIMGASGSGKSTLLNLMAGLDTPDSGRVVVAGQDLAALSDDARSDIRLHHVGIVFQNFNLFPTFTVEENVSWPLEFLGHGGRRARARAQELLAQVGVDGDAARRRPAELSGGEQQRVAIARALVTAPALLLADEPTGNLDPRTSQQVHEEFVRLIREEGIGALVATHNIDLARRMMRIVRLENGALVQHEL